MSVPALTLQDIDSDLRRLRLGRDCLAGVWRCIKEEGRASSALTAILNEEGWIAQRVVHVAQQVMGEDSGRVTQLSEAVKVLGASDVARIVFLSVMHRTFGGPEIAYGWSESDHWSHALFTGCAAEQIAAQLGYSPGLAFAAGISHGIGRYFIGWHCGRWGVRLENPGPVSSAQLREEATRFGMNQCDVGSVVLSRLGFGESLQMAVRWFCYPQFAGELAGDAERLQAAIELALIIRTQAGGSRNPWESLNGPQRHILELSLPRVRRFRTALDTQRPSVTRPPLLVPA